MYERKTVLVNENGTEVKDPDAVMAKLRRRLEQMPSNHPKREKYKSQLASLEAAING